MAYSVAVIQPGFCVLMQTVKVVLLILITVVVLGACGLKGPLYLPTENPVSEPATGQEADPATDETEKEDDAKKQDSKKKDSGNGK
jgi:predicted small lipoprotein YifL